jgi:hypothetical protein
MPIVNISDELYERASEFAVKHDRSIDQIVDLLATLFLDRMEQEKDEFTPEELAELRISFDKAKAQSAAGTLHSEEDIDRAIQELYDKYSEKSTVSERIV